MAYIGLNLGVKFGKRREILVFHKHGGGLVHSIHIGAEVDTAVQALLERQPTVGDMVLVSARRCIKAGVGVIDNPEYPEDCNILRQKRVQFECQLLGIKLTISVKVSIEIGCVHPGVGSPATYDTYLFTQQGGERLLKSLLDSRQLGLKLPSAIVGAVVGKMYEVARQNESKI